MKIVIQSNRGPYGLSRRAIEAACAVLPAGLVGRIDKLLLSADGWGAEPFEYDAKSRTAYLAGAGTREEALHELLLGFARMEAGSEFQIELSPKQRAVYDPFVEMWMPKCLDAIAENAK